MALLVVAAGIAPACEGASSDPVARRATPATPTPTPSPVINPPGIVVRNEAFGRSEQRVSRAIADLKEIELWYPLTRHLYVVKFGSRLGITNIPEDGHLADAHLTALIDEEAQGRLCDIMFFPNAIKQDLSRWRLYYSQGLTGDAPPALRHYWAAIAAHELGHCLPGGPGEKAARGWEAKALARLQDLSR